MFTFFKFFAIIINLQQSKIGKIAHARVLFIISSRFNRLLLSVHLKGILFDVSRYCFGPKRVDKLRVNCKAEKIFSEFHKVFYYSFLCLAFDTKSHRMFVERV